MSASQRQPKGFDAAVDGAWRDFRRTLADVMERLDDGATLDIRVRGVDPTSTEGNPFVEVCREGETVLVEVAGNRLLSPTWRLSRSAMARLRRLGFVPPDVERWTYMHTYPVTHVDQASDVAVMVIRDLIGVAHPALLVSGDRRLTPEPRPGSSEAWGDAVIRPLSPQHLGHVVVATLTAMLGHEPRRDADGDLVVTRGPAVAFVRCHPRRPLVQVFGHLVVDLRDGTAADAAVARLNKEHELLKFVHADGAVFVSVDLPAAPFVPAHLQGVLAHVLHVITGEQDGVAMATGGRTFLGDAVTAVDEDERIHPVMARFLQLDALDPGSVDAHAMARLCGYDDDLILEVIRWNEEQALEWTDARNDALERQRQDEADACEHERAHAERTVQLLRQALHLVLLGEGA